jgi:hypothetical protein
MIDQLLNILNQPVPHIATTADSGLYFIDAMGFGAIMFSMIWAVCLFLRHGPHGIWLMLQIVQRRRHVDLRMVLLNNWKVHGTAEGEVGPVDLREPQ